MKNRTIQAGATLIASLAVGFLPQICSLPTALAGTNTKTEPTRIREPFQGQGCPCPYDRAADNSICGGRSAYAKVGGDEPICYQGESASRQLWWYSEDTKFVDPRSGR